MHPHISTQEVPQRAGLTSLTVPAVSTSSPSPPEAVTISATTVASQLAHSPATLIDVLQSRRRCCSAAVSFLMIVSIWSKLQKISRPMYNTHPWLSKQCYGKKSAYYIRSFTVYLSAIYFSSTISLFQVTCTVASLLDRRKPAGYPYNLWYIHLFAQCTILYTIHNLQKCNFVIHKLFWLALSIIHIAVWKG